MHIITCPKCKTKLRLEKPLAKAKVRCKQCGMVFIGTSHPLPDQPEVKAAQAVAKVASQARTSPTGRAVRDVPRPYHPAPRPKGAPWMLVVVIGGVLGIIGAVFAGYYMSTHPYVEIIDENGKIVYAGRMQEDEYARSVAVIDEKKKKLAEAAKPKKPAPDNGGETITKDGKIIVGKSRPLPKDPTLNTNPRSLEDMNIPVVVDPTPIVAVLPRVDFIGEVRNNYDYPLASATVTVSIRDEEDTPIAAKTITVYNIPAKGMVPFSVDFKTLTPSKVANAKGYATGNRAPADTVCWELISSDCKKDINTTSNTFVLTGSVYNHLDFDVADTKLYVDFFDRDGRHLGTSTGKLEKLYIDKIPAGKKAHFRVDFGTFDPTIVEKWTVRVIGQAA